MRLESVQRWQWVLIGLLVGLTWWGARRWGNGDGLLDGPGECINDRATFERALITRLENRPLFKDVMVHRRTIDGRDLHIVTGLYCSGRPDAKDNKYRWRPAAFVAPIPYQSVYGARWLAGANAPAGE